MSSLKLSFIIHTALKKLNKKCFLTIYNSIIFSYSGMQTTPVHLGCNSEIERIFLLSDAELPFIIIDLPFYTTIMIDVQNLADGKSEAISTYILAL